MVSYLLASDERVAPVANTGQEVHRKKMALAEPAKP